jgi:glycosyltransferase involved in cell wall biosynthesis
MAAIDGLVASGEWPETVVLVPRLPMAEAGGQVASACARLPLRQVGRMRGHVWEQTELATAVRGGILVSLGNTAPVLAGRRQVVVIHDAGVFDTPESYSLRFRAWYKALQHGLVRTGARVVTVSQFSRQRIVARLGLDPDTVAVMREGANHILRVAADPTMLARHGLVPGRFAVVVGSRVAHKNLAALHAAAAALERRGMTIAIAGGTNPAVFRDIGSPGAGAAGPGAAANGRGEAGAGAIAGRILGRVTDAELRALYENAACLLFPSRYEGFGLPPVEAMACGCPVLAFGGGAVEEICGDAALYFGDGGQRHITGTVERLLDEDGLAGRLRVRGRQRAAALSWEASARALGDVVRRLG